MPDDTCITLKEHLEGIVKHLSETSTARFEAMDKALTVALTSLGARFENTNEWRGLVTDQLAKRITREEHDALVKQVIACIPREEFTSVANRVAGCIERGEYDRAISSIESDIRSLRESRAEVQGKATQESVGRVNTIAIIGVAVGAISNVMAIFNAIIMYTHYVTK